MLVSLMPADDTVMLTLIPESLMAGTSTFHARVRRDRSKLKNAVTQYNLQCQLKEIVSNPLTPKGSPSDE